jgi:hypothetical protein
MCPSPEDLQQTGAVAISGTVGIVGGDIVGGNKIIHGLTADELAIVLDKIIGPIDKLKQGFRDFESIKRRIFLEQIEPAFADLQRVIQSYEDYIVEFRDALSKATDFRSARVSVSEYEEKRRITVRERTKLISALEATLEYWQRKDSDEAALNAEIAFVDFMKALRSYFVGTNLDFREYPLIYDTESHPNSDEEFGNLLTESTSEEVPQGTIGTGLIQTVELCLAQYANYKESRDLDGKELIDAMQLPVRIIDRAVKSSEVRNKTVHKKFFVLKLECTN